MDRYQLFHSFHIQYWATAPSFRFPWVFFFPFSCTFSFECWYRARRTQNVTVNSEWLVCARCMLHNTWHQRDISRFLFLFSFAHRHNRHRIYVTSVIQLRAILFPNAKDIFNVSFGYIPVIVTERNHVLRFISSFMCHLSPSPITHTHAHANS